MGFYWAHAHCRKQQKQPSWGVRQVPLHDFCDGGDPMRQFGFACTFVTSLEPLDGLGMEQPWDFTGLTHTAPGNHGNIDLVVTVTAAATLML